MPGAQRGAVMGLGRWWVRNQESLDLSNELLSRTTRGAAESLPVSRGDEIGKLAPAPGVEPSAVLNERIE
jgi:hypothetical protein